MNTNKQDIREQRGRKAYEAFTEVMPSPWTWDKVPEVTREAWMHVGDVMSEDIIPALPYPHLVPGLRMQ